MLISEMIAQLQTLKKIHGDLPCYINQNFDEYDCMLVMDIKKKDLGIPDGHLESNSFEGDDGDSYIESIIISDLPD